MRQIVRIRQNVFIDRYRVKDWNKPVCDWEHSHRLSALAADCYLSRHYQWILFDTPQEFALHLLEKSDGAVIMLAEHLLVACSDCKPCEFTTSAGVRLFMWKAENHAGTKSGVVTPVTYDKDQRRTNLVLPPRGLAIQPYQFIVEREWCEDPAPQLRLMLGNTDCFSKNYSA